jgi:hypothetical protein
VPLERLMLPAALAGPTDDLGAVKRWLAGYADKPGTARSYRKEAERFLLWCTVVRKKPLASAAAEDFQAYGEFLQALPTDWIHPAPVDRTDDRWRPFRGVPAAASRRQALVIVRTMFDGLHAAGHLLGNPFRSGRCEMPPARSRTGASRAFSQDEWQHVRACLGARAPSPGRRRLESLLALMTSVPLRPDDLAGARWADLTQIGDPENSPAWRLASATRRFTMADHLVEHLRHHASDVCPTRDGMPVAEGALVRTLRASVPQWILRDGRVVAKSMTASAGEPLSVAGIHASLKRFFASVAATASEAGLDARRFEAASSLWLRPRLGTTRDGGN